MNDQDIEEEVNNDLLKRQLREFMKDMRLQSAIAMIISVMTLVLLIGNFMTMAQEIREQPVSQERQVMSAASCWGRSSLVEGC